MQELRLLFSPSGDGSFTVQLEDAPHHAVGVPALLRPFLDEDDYESLRWYLEEYMDLPDGGAVVRAQGVERQLAEWGRRLHDTVFAAPENATLLRQLLAGPESRELTIATAESALLRLPWELMADAAGSLAQRVAVRRQLEEPAELAAREVQLPLRMLYIVSRPDDTGFIDPRLTTQALFKALDPLGGHVHLDFCSPPTLARLEEMLSESKSDPYDIVHFDGHGAFLPEAQIGALCFEHPDDVSLTTKTDLVSADRLGNLLVKYQVPLVVLAACRSGTLGRTAIFRSVAPRLIQVGIGSVLSMGYAVHVRADQLLFDRFYRELARGATIGQAVMEARTVLRVNADRWIEHGPQGRAVRLQDWFLPHLYQRGADEPLLPPAAVPPEPVRQFDLFLSHNKDQKARVEKLARALSDKHGLRVWWDAWEMLPGTIEQQCDQGIQRSRFTVVAVSRGALTSRWVNWEIAAAVRHGRRKSHIIPLRLDDLEIQPELQDLHWIDLLDPAEDASGLIRLASLIRALDAADTQERRGFRPPPEHGQPGAFPRPPQYGFQGRAPELHDLERAFRRGRGIVLHAMGGMGKTTLAGEAALWWTRSGLFRDGACFISFERPINAERVIAVLGEYCGGPNFHSLPASEQRRRAIEFMRDKAVLMVWDNYESVLPAFGAPTFVVPPSGGPALGVPPLGGSEFEVPPSGGSGPDRLKPELQTPYTEAVRRELAELFHDLTTGPGRGCVLVTCRPGDTGLPGARRFELHGLARADSLWLLHRILERDGASLSDPRLARDRLEPLLRDLADHPLSLELVGPHLRTMTPEQIRADFGKLVETMRQDSDQSRNTSLRASLEFSRRHLSPAARAALPWLGLFSGGVFEINLLAICQIEPAAWTAIRAELQGIALLRTEDDRQIGDRPFLRFHPTLAIASADAGLAERPEIRERFQKVYLGLMGTLEKALRGHQSRAALAILDREEMNWRTAVRWAIASGQHPIAAALGNTFSTYLQMSGRLRERDAWVQMLHEAVTQAGFTAEAADYERQHAWTQFTQGDPKGAVDKLRSLVQRLRQTTEFDPAVQLAMTTLMLGRVLDHAGATAQAVPVLREAGGLCERLVERAGGCPWERLLKSPDHAKAAVELANLSAAMGDLSTALRNAGKHEEALVIAEKALTIDERQGDRRQVAAGHGQCARILMEMGRFDEADTRNELALDAARQAGDKELEGGLLQHQGGLARQRNQLDRATLFYQLALQRFQEADAKGHMMRTYNLLGVAEQYAGRLAESLAWYGKSRELAVHLKDQPNLGAVAGNIANVHLMEGKAARELGDEGAARRHFEEARCSVEESLKVWQTQKNKPNEAKSLVQLAQAQFELRQLDEAEDCALRGLAIDEELEIVRELPSDYYTLSEIAAARGDTAAAAEWARKRDELRAELKRRAGGGGGIPSQMLRALEALTMACARAGFGGETLDPGAEEALAKLDGFDAPFPDFSASLRRLAAGELPSLPVHLPRELHDLLESIIKAIRDQTP